MKSILQLILLTISLWSCQTNTAESNLRLIPNIETAERVKEGNFNYAYAVFKNQNGEELTKEDSWQKIIMKMKMV